MEELSVQKLEIESKGFKGHGGKRAGAGRPLGSPNKLTRPVRELAAAYGPDALYTLVEIMNHGESETARIAAAKELLDRGHGRPKTELEVNRRSIHVIVDRSGGRAENSTDVPARAIAIDGGGS